MLGSTEWVEHHAAGLRQKAVVYISTDGNGRRSLSAGKVTSAEAFINRVARDVEAPNPASASGSGGNPRSSPAVPPRSGLPPERAPISASTRLDRVGLHAVSPASGHADAQSRFRRSRRGRHLPFDLRRHVPLHVVPRHRLPTAALSRRPSGLLSYVSPRRICCRSVARIAGPDGPSDGRRCRSCSRLRRHGRGTPRRIEDGVFAAMAESAPADQGAEGQAAAASDQLRAARERVGIARESSGALQRRPPLRGRACPRIPTSCGRSTRG